MDLDKGGDSRRDTPTKKQVIRQAAVFFLPIVIIFGGLLAYIYSVEVEKEHTVLLARAEQDMRLHEEVTGTIFGGVAQDLGFVSSLVKIQQTFAPEESHHQDELVRQLTALSQTHDYYTSVHVVDLAGNEVVKVERTDGGIDVAGEDRLFDLSPQGYFIGTVEAVEGQIYVSPVTAYSSDPSLDLAAIATDDHGDEADHDDHGSAVDPGVNSIDPQDDTQFEEPSHVLVMGTPIYGESGKREGAALITISVPDLVRRIATSDKGSHGLLINADDNWIKATDSGQLEVFQEGSTSTMIDPADLKEMSGLAAGHFQSARGDFIVDTIRPMANLAVGGNGSQLYKWKIVNIVEQGGVISSLGNLRGWLAAFFAVLVITTTVGSWQLGSSLIKRRHDQAHIRRTARELMHSHEELSLAYESTLEGWSMAMELRDGETRGHTQRAALTALELGKALGMGREELLQLRWGALLHDVGKLGVPDSILLKPGPLTDEEWDEMRRHPVYAFEMLEGITYLQEAMDVAYCHHERWDGSGYPRGLKGTDIPLSARIFTVVDVWDALSSDRPYRKAWPNSKVLEHIERGSGLSYDPLVVKKFCELIRDRNGPQDVSLSEETELKRSS